MRHTVRLPKNKSMKNNRRALFLAILGASVSLSAHAAPQGFEWFPRVPGPGDQLYLIANDPCHSTSPIAPLLDKMSADLLDTDSETPFLELHYETDLFFCNTAPPSIDAVAIPRQIGKAPISTLYSFHEQQIYEDGKPAGSNTTAWIESLPATVAIPPSVAGTWISSGHHEQGLIVNMNTKRELILGWVTYGADNKQRWFTGIAPTEPGKSSVKVSLTDTGDGKFAGTLPSDAPFKDWGSLTLT